MNPTNQQLRNAVPGYFAKRCSIVITGVACRVEAPVEDWCSMCLAKELSRRLEVAEEDIKKLEARCRLQGDLNHETS